jgi:ribonuclease I
MTTVHAGKGMLSNDEQASGTVHSGFDMFVVSLSWRPNGFSNVADTFRSRIGQSVDKNFPLTADALFAQDAHHRHP